MKSGVWVKSSYSESAHCVELTWKKSSKSTANGQCVETAWHNASKCQNGECVEAGWHKAAASGGNGSCVETAPGNCGKVHIRDSKDPDGPQLAVSPAAFTAFAQAIKAGEFAL